MKTKIVVALSLAIVAKVYKTDKSLDEEANEQHTYHTYINQSNK